MRVQLSTTLCKIAHPCTCVHYCDSLVLSEAVCCVEVSTELSHHCRHVVGGWRLAQVFNSFGYPVFYTHVHTYPFIMHWLRLFVVVFKEMQCLLNFHYDVGRQDVEIYPRLKFCLPQRFPLSVTCTYICHY